MNKTAAKKMRPSFTNSSQPLLLIFPKPGLHLAGRRRLNRRIE